MPKYEKDLFESSPVLKAILKLAIPTVIGQIILVIYNMADTFFIGLTGSDAKLTAATVCMPAFMFLSAISNLFGVGGSSVISRSMGSGNFSRVKKASAFSLWGCLALTIVYSLFAWLARDVFIDLLGGKAPEVHGYARDYLMITVVIGGLATSMSTLLSHLIRSEGHSMEASMGIMLGGILNIVLDPLFMFVLLQPGQEIIGAAIATMLSNCCALLFFILYYVRHTTALSFKPSMKMLEPKVALDVLGTGLPACLMTLFENISYAVLDNLMSAYGIACQAGLGVAKKINMLAHSIVRGMSQGVLPLIGFNYAAKNFRRMKQTILYSGAISVSVALLCMAASLIFSEPLVSIFIQDENIRSIAEGAQFLRILCLGCPFSACAYAIISFFQATGKGMRSFSLAIMRKGVLDIPMMFLLNGMLPVYGIVMATPIADVLCCGAAVVMFISFLRQHQEIEQA
ncbi:MAG: MATE family efflux transporter [Clostridia bacterium]|nr:MATE family efflux transporter [Clostridia bacterium]MBR0408106.1 MATE family efflux transporter [Clostridia bacterium]